MPTQLMPSKLKQRPTRTRSTTPSPPSDSQLEPSVRRLIAAGRKSPEKLSARPAWVLSLVTGAVMWASFFPLGWGSLGFLALVPMILLVRFRVRTRWMYTATFLGGFAFALPALQWMRLGDPTMYLGWIGLSLYLAAYFPVFVFLSRTAVLRFRLPIVFAVPVIWVGLEFFRGRFGTGFPWYFLGHTQFRWTELIQISDVVGAYGVSFVVAMVAACLAELFPVAVLHKLRIVPLKATKPIEPAPFIRQAVAVGVTMSVFAGVLIYGYVRRSQAEFVNGPRVALIQGNFTTSVKHDPKQSQEIFNTHHALTGMSVGAQPDLIVWPETMYRAPLLEADQKLSEAELRRIAPRVPVERWREDGVQHVLGDLSRQSGASMIIGLESAVIEDGEFGHYNSAAFVRPDFGVAARYDKIHRVAFGEYLPFKEEMPWLHKFTPFPADYGVDAGQQPVVFDDGRWRYTTVICFEDTVPHLCREIINDTRDGNGKPIDVMVNLTNDGWFHGSAELDQHLVTASFRAVECRTPLVRSVNTGISAVIDGDGVIREADQFIDGDGQGRDSLVDPETGRWHKELNAVVINDVPLDSRDSLYLRGGDWFSQSCCFVAVLLLFGGLIPKRILNSQSRREKPKDE